MPAHTVAYARAALCEQLLWVFIPPLWIAANATGDIRNNQVHGRLITLSVLPVSYVMLCIYPNPNFPVYLMCVAQAGYWIYCVYDIHRQLGMNIRRYFRRVAVAPLLLSGVLLGYGRAVTVWLPEDSLTRLAVVLPGMTVAGAITVWGLLEEHERAYVRKFVDKRLVNK